MQQGHSPSFYRDHPQDIRHRTVQSRRPPPTTTHLIKGDPDSATSPSKYRADERQEKEEEEEEREGGNRQTRPYDDDSPRGNRDGNSPAHNGNTNKGGGAGGERSSSRLPDVVDVPPAGDQSPEPLTRQQQKEDDYEDEILDLDKELEAAIEEAGRRRGDRGKGGEDFDHPDDGVKFRTLSTSTSEDETSGAVKQKYKKTPLPKRKAKKKKVAPEGKTKSRQELDSPQRKLYSHLQSRSPPTKALPDVSKVEDTTEDYDKLVSDRRSVPPGGATITTTNVVSPTKFGGPSGVSTSVTHKEIQKFLHKSKMQMDVGDVRRAFANARSLGEKGLAASFRVTEGMEPAPRQAQLRGRDREEKTNKASLKSEAEAKPAAADERRRRARGKSRSPERMQRPVKVSSSVPNRLGQEVEQQQESSSSSLAKSLSSITTLSRPPRAGKKPSPEVVKEKEEIKSQELKKSPTRPNRQSRLVPRKVGASKAKEEEGDEHPPAWHPPLKNGPPKPVNSPEESAKRLELIKAARSSRRKIDPSSGASRGQEQRGDDDDESRPQPPPPTERATGPKQARATLPLVIKPEKDGAKKRKKDAVVYADANEEFYRDFKIIYVALPVPKDELPREYCENEVHATSIPRRLCLPPSLSLTVARSLPVTRIPSDNGFIISPCVQ